MLYIYIYTPYLCLKGCQCHIPTWLTGRDTPSIFTCQKPRLNLTNTERVKAGCGRYLRSPCYPNMTLSSGDVSRLGFCIADGQLQFDRSNIGPIMFNCSTVLLSLKTSWCLLDFVCPFVCCMFLGLFAHVYMNTIIDIPPYGCWLKPCVSS